MEITELNIITCDFESVNCLQNPSLYSRIFSISGITKAPQLYSFCKWGALILALAATFTGIIIQIKLLLLRFYKHKLASSTSPTHQLEGDEDEDESSSSASSDDDEDYVPPTTSFHDRFPVDEDFRVAGSSFYCRHFSLRRRRSRGCGDWFSWPDLTSGKKSVVKLWDSLGLGFEFEEEDSSESVVSIWDLNRDVKINTFSGMRCQIPAVAMSSPAEVILSGSNNKGNVLLGLYDTRVVGQIPAIYSEWRPRRGRVVGIDSGGVEKVYVVDDVSRKLTVGDLRRVNTPLEDLTESDGDTWFDADAVIVSDDDRQ